MSEYGKDPFETSLIATANGRDRLRILLSKKPVDPDNQVIEGQVLDGAKGTIRSHKRKHKKLLKRRTTGGIQFFDLGYRKSGASWVDIPFEVIPTYDSTLFTQPFPSASWADLKTEIFTVAVADWDTEYHQLQFAEAERWGINLWDVNYVDAGSVTPAYPVGRNGAFVAGGEIFAGSEISGTHWTSGGLNVTSDLSEFTLGCSGAFLLFDNDPSNRKITTIDDYSATAVTDFVLKSTAKVFLVPQIVLHTALEGVGADTFIVWDVFRPMRRDFFLTFTDSHWPAYPYMTTFNKFAVPSYDAPTQPAMRTYVVEHPDAQGYLNGVSQPATDWPFPLGGGTDNASIFINFGLTPVPIVEGSFLGLIKQDGNNYYVWAAGDAVYPPIATNTGIDYAL